MANPITDYYLTYAAVDPRTGKPSRQVHITHVRANHIATRGPEHVADMHVFVPRALARPASIFQGVRPELEGSAGACDWMCYIIAPSQQVMGGMLPLSPPDPGDLFLVFVNAENIAYSWRWEKPSPDNPNVPKDCEKRFDRKVM